MPEKIVELKNSLENNLHLANQTFSDNLAKSITYSALKSSNRVDKFNNWLLLFSGTLFSFTVTKITTFEQVLSDLSLFIVMSVLLLSTLFGLFSKVYGFLCGIFCDIIDDVNSITNTLSTSYFDEISEIESIAKESGVEINTSLDYSMLENTILSLFPKYLHKFAKNKFKTSLNDPLFLYKTSMLLFTRQIIYMDLQALLFFGTLVLMLISIF